MSKVDDEGVEGVLCVVPKSAIRFEVHFGGSQNGSVEILLLLNHKLVKFIANAPQKLEG